MNNFSCENSAPSIFSAYADHVVNVSDQELAAALQAPYTSTFGVHCGEHMRSMTRVAVSIY